MNPKMVAFFVGMIICLFMLLTPNPKRKLLFLLSFYFIFALGWVFYHYTGLWVYDFPLLALVFLGLISPGRFKFYFSKISLPVILILIWVPITSASSVIPGWTFSEWSKIIRGYLVFLGVANHVKSLKDLDAVLYGLFAGLVVETIISVWQWRIGPTPFWFLNTHYLRWRSTGTFFMPHFLGNYLIMIIPILLRLFLFYRPNERKMAWIYGISTGFAVLTLFITFARGPWIAFAGATLIMFLFSFSKSRYRPRIKLALVFFLLGGALFVGRYLSSIESQFGENRKQAYNVRWDQFRIARRMIASMPILGTGLGNYERVSRKYVTEAELRTTHGWQFSQMVHNSYLYFTAETGLIGGILLFWGIIVLFQTGYAVVRSRSSYFSNIGIGILTGDIAIAIAFLAGPDIHSEQFLVEFGLLTGVLVALKEMERKYMIQEKRKIVPPLQGKQI